MLNSVSLEFSSLSQLYTLSSRCWERNDIKAIWWIIRTPILLTILVRPVPSPPGWSQEFPILGSEGGGELTQSLSLPYPPNPRRLIFLSLSASLASSCQS